MPPADFRRFRAAVFGGNRKKIYGRGNQTAGPRVWGASDAAEGAGRAMFGWAIFFLLVALLAAFLGYGGVASMSMEFAKIVFWIALILLAVSLVYGLVTGRRPPPV